MGARIPLLVGKVMMGKVIQGHRQNQFVTVELNQTIP